MKIGLRLVLMLGLVAGGAGAQTTGCTLAKQVYTCDRAEAQRTLSAAKTVRVEATAQDRMVGAKLRDLVVGLGKAIPGPDEPADLTVTLSTLSTEGVLVGPAGIDLAQLRVYGRDTGGGKGALIWAETYRGQPDMSWPAVAQATIQQFRSGFKR